MKTRFLLLFIIALSANSFAQKQSNPRARWFTDARFGMFIHWGVYSGAEGIWKGEKLRNNNDYAEWIYYRNRIARDEYTTLLDRFDWDKIDPSILGKTGRFVLQGAMNLADETETDLLIENREQLYLARRMEVRNYNPDLSGSRWKTITLDAKDSAGLR